MTRHGSGPRRAPTRAVLTIVATLTLVGCVDGLVGVRGSGNVTTETREVSGFSEVALEGSGEVTITVGDKESLTIEAEDNLMSHLTSDVANGRLVLGTRDAIVTTRDIVYTITVTNLEGITVSGSGDIEVGELIAPNFTTEIRGSGRIEVSNLEADRLEVIISGSGEIDTSGTSTELDVSIPGSGRFDGEMLKAVNARVSISGSGFAVVDVNDTLDAEVSGSGTIEYLGSPTVISTVSGSGSITSR